MLYIDVVNDEELIHYLTQRKGKLDADTYLITIPKPNTQIIIPPKEGIYSEQFTSESLTRDHSRSLNRFIEELLDHVQTEWDHDHKLIIHSPEARDVSRGIAYFLFNVFPERDINNLYFNTFSHVEYDTDEVTQTSQKLLTTYEYFKAFGLDF